MENRIEVPQKIKIELLLDPAVPLLGIYTGNEISVLIRLLYSHIHDKTIHNGQEMATT
jgi:hypothetical protein